MSSSNDKLIFDAVLYVLGDMPTSEREGFEQRLIDEQAVREAVAEAVRLCQVTQDALRETKQAHTAVQPAAHVDHIWRRVAVWTAMALAASIMLALVLGVGRDRRLPEDNQGEIASASSVKSDGEKSADRNGLLAVAWLNSASFDDIVEQDDNEDIAGDSIDQEELAMADPNDNQLASEADWFFEAVTSPPAESAGSTIGIPQEG